MPCDEPLHGDIQNRWCKIASLKFARAHSDFAFGRCGENYKLRRQMFYGDIKHLLIKRIFPHLSKLYDFTIFADFK